MSCGASFWVRSTFGSKRSIAGAVVVLGCSLAPAAAQAAPVDLLTDGNIRIDGAADLAQSGNSVANAGDVNGDGRDDLIVGVERADNNARTDSGSAYVIFGQPGNGTVDLDALTAGQGFRIDGAAADDLCGGSVDGAGDFNGDGRGDLIVGARGADNNARPGSGSSYVIFGRASHTNIDLSGLTSSQGFRIDGGAANIFSASSVGGVGDFDGDSRDDVIVGAPLADENSRGNSGSSYVVFGTAASANIDLGAIAPSQGLRIDGAAASDASGESAAGAGDVNADGRDDVVIGAGGADNNARTSSGSSYVVYGRPAGSANVDLNALTQAAGFRVDGAAVGDASGSAVGGVGDFNGDGFDDVIIGALLADDNGRSDSGTSYLVYGAPNSANLDLNGLTTARGFRMEGASANDSTGFRVAGAGDVNGDGRGDAIVGAPNTDNNARTGSGSAYVLLGRTAGTHVDLAALTPGRGFRIDGASAGDTAGSAVAGAGDVNGDGRDDVAVGAPGASNNSRFLSGSTFVAFPTFLPRLGYEGTIDGQVGLPLSAEPRVARSTGAAAYSVTPPLPAGLALNSSTGAISGTPSQAGVTTHEIALSDSQGVTSDRVQIDIDNAQGPAGPPGPQGPAGPAGPAGQDGRDATVKCKVGKPKKKRKKVVVTCKVVLAPMANAISQRGTLSRAGEVVARARRAGPGSLRFRGAELRRGTYRVRARIWDRSGNLTVTASRVRIR